MITARSPGRPRGSGKDDSPYLAKVADIRVREPNVSTTAAIRRVYRANPPRHETEETFKRRLQGKWATESARLMQEAQSRAAPPPARIAYSGGHHQGFAGYGSVHDLVRQARLAVDHLYAFAGQDRLGAMMAEASRALQQCQDGLSMAQMNLDNQTRELDRAMRHVRDMQNTVQRFNQDNLMAQQLRDFRAVDRQHRQFREMVNGPMSLPSLLGR